LKNLDLQVGLSEIESQRKCQFQSKELTILWNAECFSLNARNRTFLELNFGLDNKNEFQNE
jgi:hypothetical protein